MRIGFKEGTLGSERQRDLINQKSQGVGQCGKGRMVLR